MGASDDKYSKSHNISFQSPGLNPIETSKGTFLAPCNDVVVSASALCGLCRDTRRPVEQVEAPPAWGTPPPAVWAAQTRYSKYRIAQPGRRGRVATLTTVTRPERDAGMTVSMASASASAWRASRLGKSTPCDTNNRLSRKSSKRCVFTQATKRACSTWSSRLRTYKGFASEGRLRSQAHSSVPIRLGDLWSDGLIASRSRGNSPLLLQGLLVLAGVGQTCLSHGNFLAG